MSSNSPILIKNNQKIIRFRSPPKKYRNSFVTAKKKGNAIPYTGYSGTGGGVSRK